MQGERKKQSWRMCYQYGFCTALQSFNGVTVADDNSESDGQHSTTSQHTVIWAKGHIHEL